MPSKVVPPGAVPIERGNKRERWRDDYIFGLDSWDQGTKYISST
jgi:hypothetical protein